MQAFPTHLLDEAIWKLGNIVQYQTPLLTTVTYPDVSTDFLAPMRFFRKFITISGKDIGSHSLTHYNNFHGPKAYGKEKVTLYVRGTNQTYDAEALITFKQFQILCSKMGQVLKDAEKLIELQTNAFQGQSSSKEKAQPNKSYQQGRYQPSGIARTQSIGLRNAEFKCNKSFALSQCFCDLPAATICSSQWRVLTLLGWTRTPRICCQSYARGLVDPARVEPESSSQ